MVSVITNSAENCSGSVLLPYTVIMPAMNVTNTSTNGMTRGNGVASATTSVTAPHSSTLASISLNLWLTGLGRSIRLVHSAPIDTTIAVGRSANCSAISVAPITPVAERRPR